MKNIKHFIFLGMFFVSLFISTPAFSACSCLCVGNQRQWVCSNTWDVPAGYCGGYCSGSYRHNNSDNLVSIEDNLFSKIEGMGEIDILRNHQLSLLTKQN